MVRELLITALAALPLTTLVPSQDPERVSWRMVARRFDADGDGEVTRAEFTRRPFQFRRLDRNRDGVLTEEDFERREDPKERPVATPASTDPEALAHFEEKVLPVLEAACFECHAEGAKKLRGGLRVDSLAALLEGGYSGPALVPGNPQESLIVEALAYTDEDLAMPPDERLPEEVVRDLERWIADGAPWPGATGADPEAGDTGAPAEPAIDVEAGRAWWSFRPVERPALPPASEDEWAWNEIDAFLLEAMNAAGVTPVGDAQRAAWIRRVTFDLTGLPPTPEEIEAFERDRDEDAFEQVVDRLLASPRYGERWGRHWLDVARYAESSGKDSNVLYPHAWRYRDWVIESFDRDRPYDQFLIDQLAGDLLPSEGEDERADRTIATGYLALGPKSHNTRDPRQFAVDVVDEQIDALSQGMLGLTVACARCHDHKFDPIPTRDYYAMAGIFLSTETCFGTMRSLGNLQAADLVELPAEADVPDGPTMPVQVRRFLERQYEAVSQAIEGGGTRRGDLEDLDERTAMLRMRIARDSAEQLEDLLSRFDERGRPLPSNRLAMGTREARARDARVLARGELDEAGERVERGFLQVLSDASTPSIERGSGRLELARWIASPGNPLTARVWVNRVWMHLFGRGIVATPNNFGASGQAPSHPELLDWLATTFVADGWSTKALVRRVVLSHAYRLDTAHDAQNARIDPEAVTLWRMPARRLEAEALRDAMLFAAGTLDLRRPVGSPVGILEGRPQREELLDRLTAEQPVRSVYLPVLRDRVPPALEVFDCADPSFVAGDREETIVATQALYLMNDEAVLEAADALMRRLFQEEQKDAARIERAFVLTLGRAPTSVEKSAVQRFLRDFERIAPEQAEQPARGERGRFGRSRERERGPRARDPEEAAWSAFVQSLFQTAEFRYRG